MAQDPFLEVIPELWSEPTTGRLTAQASHFLEYLSRHLEQGWELSDQGDSFSNLGTRELYSWQGMLDEEPDPTKSIYPLINPIVLADSAAQFEVIVTDVDYETSGNQIVICTNLAGTSIDVTLNPYAEDLENVRPVRQGAGKLNVIGPALGDTTMEIGSTYSSPNLMYITAISSWVVL